MVSKIDAIKELKEKYSDRKKITFPVSPLVRARDKHYRSIACFYKEGSGGYLSDCFVYALTHSDTYDFLGHADELYQISGTFFVLLEQNELTAINPVSNERVVIGHATTVDNEKIRNILHVAIRTIMKGKITLDDCISIRDKYGRFEETSRNYYIIVSKEKKFGIINIHGEELLPTIFDWLRLNSSPVASFIYNNKQLELPLKYLSKYKIFEYVLDNM